MWGQVSSVPHACTEHGAAWLNGRLWVVGGFDGHQTLDLVHVWRGLGGSAGGRKGAWERGAPLPVSRSGHVVVELGGKLYVIGGTTTSERSFAAGWRAGGVVHLADVCVWDESVGVWAPGVPMQRGRYRFAATVVEGRIYALGGIADEGVTASVESWAPGEEAWHVEPDLPAPRFGHRALCLAGRLYVMGGVRKLQEQVCTR